MRILAATLALACMTHPHDADVRARDRPLLAGLGDSVPQLFLKLVNDAIKGHIAAGKVTYVAPSSVVLDNAVLSDPDGVEVARAAHAQATLSLSSLLAGEIVVSRIEIDQPLLGLTYKDNKLNLLEAFVTRKPPDPNKPNDTAVRIDTILVKHGHFTFTDGQNVTVTADEIAASATLEVDLKHDLVIVDVHQPTVAKGVVQLQALDVPLQNIGAKGVRILKDRVELTDVTATAAGAAVKAAGSIIVKDAGTFALHGVVDGPKNAWPDKLKRLPFETPAVHGIVDLTGAFANPQVAIDATFARAEAYNYVVDSGRGVVLVTKDLVTIKDGTYVKAGGTVAAVGTLKIADLALDLKLKASDVPVAQALLPAQLEPKPSGTLSGRATLTGIADGEKPIVVDAAVTAHRTEISAFKARGDLEGTARITVRPKRVIIDAASLKGDHLEASASGDVFTDEERIALKLSVQADDATTVVPAVPEDVRADHASFDGTVVGPYKSVRVDGRVAAGSGRAYGVPVKDLTAHVNAGADEVLIDDTHAKAADGDVTLVMPIRIKLKEKEKKAITGTVHASGVDLALIHATAAGGALGDALPITGRADGEAVLVGPYDDPTVGIRASAGGLTVSGEDLGQATARGTVTKRLLTITDVTVHGGLMDGHSDDVRLTIPALVVDGHVHVDALDLARVHAAASMKLAGIAHGLVIVRGDVKAPDLSGKLFAVGVSAGTQHFGDGNVDVTLAPDVATSAPANQPASKSTKSTKSTKNASAPVVAGSKGHVVGVATHLASNIGVWDVAASYAIERQVVNAKAHLSDVDLAPLSQALGSAVAPLEGFASGVVEASGPLDKLNVRVRMRSPEVAVSQQMREAAPVSSTAPASSSSASSPAVMRPLGALLVDARMEAGALNARVCAFPTVVTPSTTSPSPPRTPANTAPSGRAPETPASSSSVESSPSPCTQGERDWATIVGDVDAMHGAVDLSVNGEVEESALEDIFPALAARGFAVSAHARIAAQIVRTADHPVDVRAQATVVQASVQPQGSLRADLVGTTDVLYADNRVQLVTPARFAAATHDVDVVVGGSIGTEDIALDVKGSLSLGIAKAFTQQIANANGTAETTLKVRGRYDKGITVEGSLTPAVGAVVTPRALGQSITFQGGGVDFAPVDSALIRVTAANLRARLGEGTVQVKGSVDVRTARTTDQGLVARWHLSASGSGLEAKLTDARGEGAVDLSLEGDEATPTLKGRVEITDGLYRKTLELRNFVLQAPPEKDTEPLYVTLTPLGLQNLELDVAVSLQNFRARATVANFDADLQLRGDLHLRNSLRLPKLDGAIDVEEGTVDFPRARFEVVEMQVEFPSTGGGRVNPQIHMNARAELPPGAAGTNDTEIPVDLFLDGDLQGGLKLDLSATDPQREWSRSDLLGLILFGKTLNSVAADRDTSLAVRALMTEATAPLTQELESLAERTFGVQVEIDPGGWRWQLGRRLQLEGPGLLVSQTATTTPSETTPGAVATSTTTTTTGAAYTSAAAATSLGTTDAIRLRLLIIDHLWVGKNLSLEGSSGSLGSELRLQLRLFEE